MTSWLASQFGLKFLPERLELSGGTMEMRNTLPFFGGWRERGPVVGSGSSAASSTGAACVFHTSKESCPGRIGLLWTVGRGPVAGRKIARSPARTVTNGTHAVVHEASPPCISEAGVFAISEPSAPVRPTGRWLFRSCRGP